jgi:transcription elongation GreA/GreB family factor
MSIKEKLFNYCLNYILARIDRFKKEVHNAQLAANEETKSSAGDKYETGRAMAQIEIERNMQQLNEAEKLLHVLSTIDLEQKGENVQTGSFIETSQGNFFIAISIGMIELDTKSYFIVSAESPVGKQLLGKRKGEQFKWNNKECIIELLN